MSNTDDESGAMEAQLIEAYRAMDERGRRALRLVCEYLADRPNKDTEPLTKEQIEELFERALNLQ